MRMLDVADGRAPIPSSLTELAHLLVATASAVTLRVDGCDAVLASVDRLDDEGQPVFARLEGMATPALAGRQAIASVLDGRADPVQVAVHLVGVLAPDDFLPRQAADSSFRLEVEFALLEYTEPGLPIVQRRLSANEYLQPCTVAAVAHLGADRAAACPDGLTGGDSRGWARRGGCAGA